MRVHHFKIISTFFKGPVIRATFFFNLSCNIVAVQVETLCCAYYHLRDQLAKSRLEFYFLQQILVLLLVLPTCLATKYDVAS